MKIGGWLVSAAVAASVMLLVVGCGSDESGSGGSEPVGESGAGSGAVSAVLGIITTNIETGHRMPGLLRRPRARSSSSAIG